METKLLASWLQLNYGTIIRVEFNISIRLKTRMAHTMASSTVQAHIQCICRNALVFMEPSRKQQANATLK